MASPVQIKARDEEIAQLRSELRRIQAANVSLQQENSTLLENISILYNTAKEEIRRKDEELKEVRREIFTIKGGMAPGHPPTAPPPRPPFPAPPGKQVLAAARDVPPLTCSLAQCSSRPEQGSAAGRPPPSQPLARKSRTCNRVTIQNGTSARTAPVRPGAAADRARWNPSGGNTRRGQERKDGERMLPCPRGARERLGQEFIRS